MPPKESNFAEGLFKKHRHSAEQMGVIPLAMRSRNLRT